MVFNKLNLKPRIIFGNTTDDFTSAEAKLTSLRGNIYDISVDYLNLDFSRLMSMQGYIIYKKI